MKDRRSYPRIEHSFPVDIRLFDVPPTATAYKLPLLRGQTADLSKTGLRILSPIEMPVGHRMHLRVVVDNPPSSYMHTALVRWVKPEDNNAFSAGVEFVMETATSQQDWSELMEQISRDAQDQVQPSLI